MPSAEYLHVHTTVMPHEEEASVRPSDSSLCGKRPASATSAPAWYPNAGVPCYSFGEEESKRQCTRLHRTTLLFKDLETSVHSLVESHRAKMAKERAESARIAAANPLVFLPHLSTEESTSSKCIAVEGKSVIQDKVVRRLPAPLSEALLLGAMPELSAGASFAIKSCVDCWRENRLTDSDLLSTIRSFAGLSATLSKAFHAVEEYEVASLEDMKALSALACMPSQPNMKMMATTAF